MFFSRQFFFLCLLLAAFVIPSMGRHSGFRKVSSESNEDNGFDSNERIVVKAEPKMALRTRRPFRYAPVKEQGWHENK